MKKIIMIVLILLVTMFIAFITYNYFSKNNQNNEPNNNNSIVEEGTKGYYCYVDVDDSLKKEYYFTYNNEKVDSSNYIYIYKYKTLAEYNNSEYVLNKDNYNSSIYEFDEENLTVSQESFFDETLQSNIDYSNHNWLYNYLEFLEKIGYFCKEQIFYDE